MNHHQKKKGGLLKDLEEKIEASNIVLNLYEKYVSELQLQNQRINKIYNGTYNFEWLKQNLYNWNSVNLIEWRQSLIEKICHNNDMIEKYKKDEISQMNINSFLKNIYFYINNKKNNSNNKKLIKK